jgi:toxin secretion/phage lysis holin
MTIYLITFLFILLDFATGIIKALYLKEFTSSGMREGLFHKVGSIICVSLGYAIDFTSNYLDLGIKVPIATAICTYIVLMEITSIIENIGKINPTIVPQSIRKYFGKLTEDKADENK